MKTMDIEDLFTEANERDGVWFEPQFDGVKCGIELLLIGINSDEAISEMDKFDAMSAKIKENSEDEEKKKEELFELDAERMAALTKDIRASDGSTLQYKGKPVDKASIKEVAKELYMNSPDIKGACVDFVLKSTNFMKIKRA
jgi:hypothetical protein